MTRLCVRSRRRSQAHRARVHGVIQVFEVLAKNLMMKTMERKRYRLVLEQAVALSPEVVKQEDEHVLDDGTEEGDDSVEYVPEAEAEDGILEGDGGYVDGDGGGEHEDEEVPEQGQGSEGEVSEHRGRTRSPRGHRGPGARGIAGSVEKQFRDAMVKEVDNMDRVHGWQCQQIKSGPDMKRIKFGLPAQTAQRQRDAKDELRFFAARE